MTGDKMADMHTHMHTGQNQDLFFKSRLIKKIAGVIKEKKNKEIIKV